MLNILEVFIFCIKFIKLHHHYFTNNLKTNIMKGIILLFFTFFFYVNNTQASCGCEELTVKKAYEKSDLIFTGKLINKEILSEEIKAPKIAQKQLYTRVLYTFEIEKLYKGKVQKRTIKIQAKYNNINFVKGRKYLVYAYLSKYLLTNNFYINGEKVTPFLATDNCTKSRELRFVEKKELKKLKKRAKREH